MTNPDIQAVIFDMDGLLVDSEPVWAICERELLARRGKVWTADIQQHLIGMRMDDFLLGMISSYGLDDTVEVMRDELEAHMCRLIPERVVPQPGARALLAFLRERGIPCAIASSSPQSVIDAVVDGMGWGDVFKARVSGEIVPNGKPAPDVYLEAARQLGVKPRACLALEDSPNGARAAVSAGMTTLAVPDLSHSKPEALARVTPHVFHSLHDVLEWLSSRVPQTARDTVR